MPFGPTKLQEKFSKQGKQGKQGIYFSEGISSAKLNHKGRVRSHGLSLLLASCSGHRTSDIRPYLFFFRPGPRHMA